MKSTTELFLDAVVDRHARMANRLEVASPAEFAERIAHLPVEGDVRAPSFMARTRTLRSVFGEVQS
jgi:hypothetical protein